MNVGRSIDYRLVTSTLRALKSLYGHVSIKAERSTKKITRIDTSAFNSEEVFHGRLDETTGYAHRVIRNARQ